MRERNQLCDDLQVPLQSILDLCAPISNHGCAVSADSELRSDFMEGVRLPCFP